MHSKNSKPRRLLEKPRIKTLLLAGALLALLPNLAAAVEFRSIAPSKAVLYDAPSQQGKKLFIISQGSPVEVIVNLREWVKIRDHLGGLSWIPADQLSPKHTVMVTQARAEVRQTAEAHAPVGAYLEKNVVLEMLEPPKNGWIKVRHRDGLVGYILASSVWGY